MNPRLHRAMILVDQSRYDMAEQELQHVLLQDPNDAMAHSVLGICLASRDKFEEASREAELGIHLSPDLPFVFYAHSIVLGKRNWFREAQTAIEEAIGRDPYCPEHFAQLAYLQFEQHRWKEALAAAEEGLALDPEDVACTNFRAMALVKLGRKIEAEESLRTALQRAPEDGDSHASMGWSLLEQGQSQKAMEHFREALRLEPNLEWARIGIIEAMKSQYFIYRLMLSWFLWMTKLSSGARWGVLIGAYAANLALSWVADTYPSLAPWLAPFLIAYVVFVVMTWVAGPLFDLMLRLNRFGRLALSKEQTRTSTWVGLCFIGAIGFIAAYLLTGVFQYLICGLSIGLLIPVIVPIYGCQPGWPRATILLITIALVSLSAIVVCCTAISSFFTGELRETVRLIGVGAFIPFVIVALASQFGVNVLVAARPRSRSTRKVWLGGGCLLTICGAAFALAAGCMLLVALDDEYGGPVLFDMPIRTKLIVREDLVWNHANEVNRDSDMLQSLGFVVVGDYVFDGLPGVCVRCLVDEKRSIVAELSEQRTTGYHASLSSVYTDGRVVSYGNGAPQLLETPPSFSVTRCNAPVAELCDRLQRERPKESIRTMTRDDVPNTVATIFGVELDYLLNRGGPNAAEMRAMASQTGSVLSDSTIARLQKRWRRQAAAKVDEFVVRRFLEENSQWQDARDRILCVHELLEPNTLFLYRIEKGRVGPEKRGELRAMTKTGSRREAFARMANPTSGFKKIGEATVPIPTDIYLIEK